MGSLITMLHGEGPPAPAPSTRGAVAATEEEVEAGVRALVEVVPAALTMQGPPLIRAAAADDRPTLRQLLQSADGVNARDGGGRSPLHWAVAADEEAVLRAVLALSRRRPGIELDATDDMGCTALHYASVTRNSFAMELLLAAGASTDIRDQRWQTPLMKAAMWDDVPLCRALLDAGAAMDITDAGGMTALHVAASSGSTGAAVLLLERGADATLADRLGCTPLTCALRRSQKAAAQVLLPSEMFAPRADYTGSTELHWAAANGTAEMVERLLRLGPARWPRDKDGMRPLLRALQARNEATAMVLLESPHCRTSRRIRDGAADNSGQTALHWAARAGLSRVVAKLLEAGYSAWTPDHRGRDALMWALIAGDQETVTTLLLLAGYQQRADQLGRTALHLAAVRANAAATLQLLQLGADDRPVDCRGWTPLGCAIHYNAHTVMDVLLCCAKLKLPH